MAKHVRIQGTKSDPPKPRFVTDNDIGFLALSVFGATGDQRMPYDLSTYLAEARRLDRQRGEPKGEFTFVRIMFVDGVMVKVLLSMPTGDDALPELVVLPYTAESAVVAVLSQGQAAQPVSGLSVRVRMDGTLVPKSNERLQRRFRPLEKVPGQLQLVMVHGLEPNGTGSEPAILHYDSGTAKFVLSTLRKLLGDSFAEGKIAPHAGETETVFDATLSGVNLTIVLQHVPGDLTPYRMWIFRKRGQNRRSGFVGNFDSERRKDATAKVVFVSVDGEIWIIPPVEPTRGAEVEITYDPTDAATAVERVDSAAPTNTAPIDAVTSSPSDAVTQRDDDTSQTEDSPVGDGLVTVDSSAQQPAGSKSEKGGSKRQKARRGGTDFTPRPPKDKK